jgi:hypothetical protein
VLDLASGDTLAVFFPYNSVPGDADSATLDTILTASADEPDNIIPVLDFDPGATEEYTYFPGFMPGNYDAGGFTVVIGWSSDATSGNVIWNLAWKSVTDDADDLDSKAFAAPNASAADATANVAGEVAYTEITFTDGADSDSVAANEYFWLELSRNSSNGSDTLNSNDAEFHFLVIKET